MCVCLLSEGPVCDTSMMDSCFIPWYTRKSETYPPPTANGMAQSHGMTLYTHPCKNRQVRQTCHPAAPGMWLTGGCLRLRVSTWNKSRLNFFISGGIKHLGGWEGFLEVRWQPGQYGVGGAGQTHVSKHHRTENKDDKETKTGLGRELEPSAG